ncbi:MAG TPA: divergent PAP2 family protein [Chloroflexi bacterium]|nr:divergent PAP2 family protein [Chloroflexota bacterium]
MFAQLAVNDILWVSIAASSLAQFLKPFTYWLSTGEFEWGHIAETGGMPSSHSAMVSALAAGVGMEWGFDSPTFAIAAILAAIVIYDAAGIRRQAGAHAYVINRIIAELLSGHPIQETHLQEVLGHSRKEVAGGVLFGAGLMVLWKLIVQPLFLG